MRRSLALLVLAATLALGAGGCGDDDDGAEQAGGFEEATEPTPDQMLTVVSAVCSAAGLAPADAVAANKTFAGQAHDGLHSIARQLEPVDRGVAATLLRAKEQVESDFANAAANETIHSDLLALAGAAGDGVQRLAPDSSLPACG